MQMQMRHVAVAVLVVVAPSGRHGSLMDTHRVGKRTGEQVIVTLRDVRQDLCERGLFFRAQLEQ